MSSESEIRTEAAEPEHGPLAPEAAQQRDNGRRHPPAANHAEAQLRPRVAQLEAQLVEAARCLEAAEHRAAEVVALRAEVVALRAEVGPLRESVPSLEARLAEAEMAERTLAVIRRTNSWRFTAPVRICGGYVRRLLGLSAPHQKR